MVPDQIVSIEIGQEVHDAEASKHHEIELAYCPLLDDRIDKGLGVSLLHVDTLSHRCLGSHFRVLDLG